MTFEIFMGSSHMKPAELCIYQTGGHCMSLLIKIHCPVYIKELCMYEIYYCHYTVSGYHSNKSFSF